jgi:catechol 2,3-dioxygenase-like lactoylglutathione lyase family enzyme
MIQTTFGHIVFHVDPANIPFYKALTQFLGWQPIFEAEGFLGTAHGDGSIWFMGMAKAVENDYDGPGMNHFAFAAASIADVDSTTAFLTEQGVAHLFETPRHRPDFSRDESHTYYQVMFESPDRILFEVVYIGPK